MTKHLLAGAALAIALTGGIQLAAAQPREDPLGDKPIARADAQAAAEARFAALDTNHDGQLSPDELAAGRGPGGGGFGGGRGGPGGGASGPVAKDAFVARALTRFDAMDADHDGQVTRAERDAARAAMRQRWQDQRPAEAPGSADNN